METIESKINGYTVDGKCLACGHVQKMNIFPYVNFSKNPEYYAKVKDLSIFLFDCEECHAKFISGFDSLFQDSVHKYFIYLLTSDVPSDKFKYQLKFFIETNLNEEQNKDLSDYKTRIVTSVNDLIEKMTIFESGLNDKAIEMIKLVILEQDYIDVSEYNTVFFEKVEADKMFFNVYDKDDARKHNKVISIDIEFYNKIIEQVNRIDKNAVDMFETIDQSWAIQHSSKTENK